MTASLATALAFASGCGSTVSGGPAGPEPSLQQHAPALSARAPSGGSSAVGAPAGTEGATSSASPPIGAQGGTAGVAAARVVAGTGRAGGPIRLGFLSTNNDAAASAGVNNGNSFQEQQVFEALVAAYNAKGGMDGRRIQPFYRQIKSSSTNYPGDLQAVCTAFTQDAHVAAVISATGLWSQQFATCLAQAGVPQIEGSYAVGDSTDLAGDRSVLFPTTLSTNQRVAAVLRQLASTGYLSSRTVLGVVVEGCPDNERAYRTTLVPAAKALGVPLAPEFTSSCFQGINGFGGLAADMQDAALRFKTEGVQRVTFVSSVEGDLLLLFSSAAASDNYHPGYALSSLALPVVAEANMPPDQLPNFKGLGWLPILDTNGAATSHTKNQDSCLTQIRDGNGPPPSSAEDSYFAYVGCDTFALLTRELQLGGGRVEPGQVLTIAHQIGRTLTTASTYGGQSDFSSGAAAAAAGREFTWSGACRCFTYVGPVVRMATVDR